MAESGTYDQATILRRQKLAEQMLAQSSRPPVIRNPVEGLGYLANVGVDAFALNRLDKQAAESRKADTAALMSILNGGGGAQPSALSAVASPSPAPAMPPPSPSIGDRTRMAESGGDPLAKNPNSSATGPDQFINSTWLDTIKSSRPDLAAGKDDATLLAMRTDPELSGQMRDAYATQNRRLLSDRGLPVTPGSTYLAHFAGPEGASKVLSADPKMRVAELLSPGAMQANPMLANMTAGDMRAWADRKMGDGAPAPAVAQAMSPTAALPPPSAPVATPPGAAPPPAAPGALPTNQPAGIPPQQRQAIAALMMATPGSPAQQLGIQLAAQSLKPRDYGFQTLPDGTILRTDPHQGTVAPIYQAPTKPTFGQIGEGAFGDKSFGFIDPIKGTVKPASAAAVEPSATGVPGGDSSFMAKGIASIDHTLKGSDYLAQFSPEVQSAVRNHIDGKSTPTGNPRKGFTQAVKMISQKYGEDIGQPADDASFSARRTMRNQLSSGGAGTLGGQINFGNTAMGHLADMSQRALELDNSSGLGITPLAHAVNTVRGLSTNQAAKMQALQDAAQHYGQEITKFYAGSPGGEAERNRFMNAVSSAKSPQELAAVLEQEAELIPSRLSSITGQIKTTLGDQGVKDFPVVRPESEKALERIKTNVDRLRGGRGATAASSDVAPKVGEEKQFKQGVGVWNGTAWVPKGGPGA